VADELWVIEAPGKAKTLEGILRRLGRDARVQATRGHLFAMPDTLNPVGIDRDLVEFLRAPRDPAVVARLREEARAARTMVVATDADQEGDVIAWDVREACADIHPEPLRVRLRAMDDDGVRDAIAAAGAVRREDAVPGRTRALVDRLIGATFSGGGVAVGRVGTALLGLVAAERPSVHVLRLSAPAQDGGRPFFAETPVRHPLDLATAGRVARLPLPPLPVGASRPSHRAPRHTGGVLVRASEALDISPGEASRAMQRSYEAGRMSYPRSGSEALGRAASQKVREMIRKSGFAFDAELVPQTDPSRGDLHDAPHPVGPPVALASDPRKYGHDEGVRVLVARDLVRCGQRHVAQTPLTAKLLQYLLQQGLAMEVAQHVAGLDWRREDGPPYPGKEAWPASGVVRRRADAVLLEAAVAAGLGRPSTWANHVEGFVARGLVDGELRLTAKGRAWMSASPPSLLVPAVSAAIERACERAATASWARPAAPGQQPHEAAAAHILSKLPAELRGPIAALLAATPPQPRQDPTAGLGPGLDADGLRAALAAPAPAPAPRPPSEDL